MNRLPLDMLLTVLPSPPRHVLTRLVHDAVGHGGEGEAGYQLQPYLRRRPRRQGARLRPFARGSCPSIREDQREPRRKRKRRR